MYKLKLNAGHKLIIAIIIGFTLVSNIAACGTSKKGCNMTKGMVGY